MPLPRSEPPQATTNGRIERELERERQEHATNHDAKAHLGDEDERHKDARETTFSSTVRRFK